MKSYAELLKDPRWQRRRLQILQRSNFSCEWCDDTKRTLHVHHMVYRRGAVPWDYTDDELVSICENCHEQWHSRKKARTEKIKEAIHSMDPDMLGSVLGYCQGLRVEESFVYFLSWGGGVEDDLENTSIEVSGWYQARGLAHGLGLRGGCANGVLDKLENGSISIAYLLNLVREQSKHAVIAYRAEKDDQVV